MPVSSLGRSADVGWLAPYNSRRRRAAGRDTAVPLLGDQHPVELGQSFGIQLGGRLAGGIKRGLRPTFHRYQFACPVADAMGKMVADHVEDAAIVEDAPDDDVGVAGVVVIDRACVQNATRRSKPVSKLRGVGATSVCPIRGTAGIGPVQRL